MESLKALEKMTERLLEYTLQFQKTFELTREKNADGDFYSDIKPFADKVKEINDQWKEAALRESSFLARNGISIRQIENAHEHIDKLSIQAFFVKTSRYTFINSCRTVEYTLKTILDKLKP
ncbi:hypothetical protein A8F94_03220 [Bacillus sp. FJAT-27225]|uniref:DUF1798 family protein n=1 Tax=Bacillus sp. FJAT-27225 TaxID=1743144 RepID=UPI00080C221B|nr:DUF1798 family protein [Bacillus sp. FJAT-27225]OCA90893.1 hypothetical protein A8F94_03220 [Bacillus sp. FJAT-27225]